MKYNMHNIKGEMRRACSRHGAVRKVDTMIERQQKILELLAEQGEVTIRTLSKLLGVSEMTIHRDLDALEKEGLLKKKRSGAIFIDRQDTASVDPMAGAKAAIAREAIKLIDDNDSIIFDNSTTGLEAAKLLGGFSSLTVYATNLDVANEVRAMPNIILYASGGFYLHASTGFVGNIAEEFVARLHVSKCIIGASGISAQYGITGPYPLHSELERKIIEASETVILLADHTKFGKVAIEKIADIDEIDYLITDSEADPCMLNELADKTTVIVTEVSG